MREEILVIAIAVMFGVLMIISVGEWVRLFTG